MYNSFAFALILVAIIFSAIAINVRVLKKGHPAALLVQFLIHLVLIVEGTAFYYILYEEFDIGLTINDEIFERILMACIPLLSMMYSTTVLFMEKNDERTQITPSSVHDGFSEIDCGVCYAEQDGTVVMANELMQKLSLMMMSRNITNAISFWDRLVGFDKNDNARRILFTKEPSFIFTDGRVFSFSRNTIEGDGKKRYEIIARNVTNLYNKSEELVENNAKLEEVELRLSETYANIAAVKQEEELISYKLHIHDELGNSILSGVSAMRRENISREERQELIENWEKTLNDLSNNLAAGNIRGENTYVDLFSTAKMLGITLDVRGAFPRLNDIATMAVREAMYNAVKHSGADVLYVNAEKTEGSRVIVISDNGTNKENVNTEGGGLSNLRRKIEKQGGTLDINWEERVVLTIVLPERF